MQLGEAFLHPLEHGFFRRNDLVGAAVLVPSALAVDAVEGTEFAVVRQEVDAQGVAQAAALYGAEDYLVKKYRGHNVCCLVC